MSFGQDDVWTNPVNDGTRGSREGGRFLALENHKFYRFTYRNMKLDPLPLGKVGPPGNVGPSFSMAYQKVIV